MESMNILDEKTIFVFVRLVATPHPLWCSTPERHKAAASAHVCTLCSHDCSAIDCSKGIIKFVDYITIDKQRQQRECRDEVAQQMRWCKDNSLALIVSKNMVLILTSGTTEEPTPDWMGQGCKLLTFPGTTDL